MDENLSTRIVKFVLIGVLTVGGGAALIEQTRDMAKAALEAQQHQMSYSKFTRALVNNPSPTKPIKLPKGSRQ